jgi:hypothetical protein
MKDLTLARRELLRRLGLGAACLPLLRARSARAATRRHLVIVQLSQGYRQAYWRPMTGALNSAALPPTLVPFAPYAGDLVVLPGLTMPGAGLSGRSAYGVMFYGLGATGTGTYREPTGPTLDQIVAKALPAPGGRTSLNLGVMLDRAAEATPPGGRYCFWTGAGQPIRPLLDPYAVYADLFGGPADTTTVKRLLLRRKSILDYATDDLQQYRQGLGLPEREAVEAHLQALRELEGQLQQQPTAPGCPPGAPPAPPVDPKADTSYPILFDLQMKIMVAALRCGITNVVTLQLSDASADQIDLGAFIPGLPRPTGFKSPIRTWRDVGHNPLVAGQDLKKIVDRWFMERLADLLRQLREATEDGTSILDDSIVLVGNHMEDGSTRNAQRIPWMLAGKAGGWLSGGQCLASEGQPVTRVMAGICEALGVGQHPYGEVLPGLKKA